MYEITISGTVPADTSGEEQQIADAFTAAITALGPDAGISTATGTFDTLGQVDLLPTVNPLADVEDAVDQLAAAVMALPGVSVTGTYILTADEFNALVAAANSVEQAVEAVDTTFTPPPAPAPAAGAVPIAGPGFAQPAAEQVTNQAGEAVAI